MADKFDFSKIEKKARTALERSLILIGNTAKNHFIQSFRNQGFDDKSIKRWMPRKGEVSGFGVSKKSKGSRAILVKSGDLRRSIKLDTINKSNLGLVISSDLPYSKIHNEGGIVYRKAHKRTATITRYTRGSATIVKGKLKQGKKQKLTLSGERHNVKASSFKMPKRQFMGDSYNMNEKIKKIITNNLDKTFK